MAEEHKESDKPKKKNDPIRREEERRAEGVEASSATSEGKSASSSRVTGSVSENPTSAATSVSKKSESASGAAAKGAVTKTVSRKKRFFAKWQSPPKKQTGGSGGSAESEKESPDKQQRSATASTGKVSGFFKNVKKFFVGSKSCDEVQLAQPEATSRPHGEGTSGQTSNDTNPETSWEPKHKETTGQEWENLHGRTTVSEETIFVVKTEMTSLSGSVSLGVENVSSLPLDRMDSGEGSTGDASSLEKEFEDLSSPSKSAQGKKRAKDPLEEEDCAMESSVSPRKRPTLNDTDRIEKCSDSEID